MRKLKLSLLNIFFLLIVFGFFSIQPAFADTFTLSGSVKDSSGNAISNSTVSVNDASSSNTTTDSAGNYTLVIEEGTYNVQVTPPSGSGFTSATAVNQNISGNTVLNFVLVPTGTVALTGRVLDRSNQPLANQTVGIAPQGTNNYVFTTTDSSGNYSFSTTSGNYKIQVSGSNSLSVSAPPSYSIVSSGTLALTQSIIMDIPLPVKQVTVHVQDTNGVAQPNVGLSTNSISMPSTPIGTVTNATGVSSYSPSTGLTTDASGNAVMWFFPTPPSGNRYTITATPPSGSSYVTTNLSSVAVVNDSTVTLTIQQPVTLSGKVLDRANQPLSNQTVGIAPQGTSTFTNTTTDSAGNYSFSVAPGNYRVQVLKNNNPLTVNAPPNYSIISSGTLSLTQNTTMDIPLPVKQVSIHVQDPAGNALEDVTLSTNSVSMPSIPVGTVTNATGISSYSVAAGLKTDASGNATMWLFQTPTSGNRYTLTATPPSGSPLMTTNLSSVAIPDDTSITLTMQQQVTLTGRVLNALGAPLSNQTVSIAPASTSNFVNSVTDANGNYSFTVTSGNYLIKVAGTNALSSNAPPSYSITSSGTLALTQNTTMDIPLPLKEVTVHVQDINGNAVPNVALSTNAPSLPSIAIGSVTNATGIVSYGASAGLTTDASGDATMWLFSTPPSGNRYTITAQPPVGSIFDEFILTNVAVTADQTELISLQYNHATPTTIASITTEYEDETYSNPATVTLSATAASGYFVANTYYTIDGGSAQTYTAPFTVSENGNHTITYWSVDDSGAQEQTKTKSFTIAARYDLTGTVYVDANQNGFQDTGEAGYSGATIELDAGPTATTDANGVYTFSDLVYGTYEATLTLPTGYTATTTNPASVALNANTTQNFGIFSGPTHVTSINAGGSTSGDFVADTGYAGGSLYATTQTVNTTGVTNPAPQDVYKTVRYGNFTYTVTNLTPNAAYGVRLHFNELYWNNVGARVFDVKYNGQTVLDNYDIYESAGGKNKAVVAEVNGTADSNGTVTLQFVTEFDNAMVNGIELYSGTLNIPSPTPTPTLAVPYGINTGGSAVSGYVADRNFSGGSLYTSTSSVDLTGVTNPAPEVVYKSVRYGNFTYTLPNLSPNTDYLLRLHFNELYWNSAGSRVFDVSVNGTQVLNDYDIYQVAGGKNKAVVSEIPVTANSSGNLVVQFSTVVNNAMVNGLEVVAAE